MHICSLRIKLKYFKVKERVLKKQKKTSEPQKGTKSRKGKGVRNHGSPLCRSHFALCSGHSASFCSFSLD